MCIYLFSNSLYVTNQFLCLIYTLYTYLILPSILTAGNLNRHKKVKHGLDETTENMEVDAVKFLSSMSGRTRLPNSDNENDPDSDDGNADSKSNKKGRKSVPKKLLSKKDEDDGKLDAEHDDESDLENVITYSDEEREIERLKGGKHVGILLEAGKVNDIDTPEKKAGTVNDIDTPEKNTPTMSTRGQRSCRNRKRKTLHDDFTGLDDSDEEQDRKPPAKRKQT